MHPIFSDSDTIIIRTTKYSVLVLSTTSRNLEPEHFVYAVLVAVGIFILKTLIFSVYNWIQRRRKTQQDDNLQSVHHVDPQETVVSRQVGASILSEPAPAGWRPSQSHFHKVEETLQSIPMAEASNSPLCPICLDDMELDHASRLAQPSCGHTSHRVCLRSWMVRDPSLSCPMCRTQLASLPHETISVS